MGTVTLASGTDVFYEETGFGPRFLQIHGVGLGHWNVGRVTEYLKSDFTCIDIDLPGYGRSSPPANSGGIVDLADEVADFIRAFNGDPLPLHGTSYGGLVAVALAGRHPDVVSRVVISVCLPRQDKAAQHRRKLWATAAAMENARLYADLTVHSGFSRAFFERDDADIIIEELVAAMEDASPNAKAYKEGVDSMLTTDVLPIASEIRAAALVLGGAEDQMTPVDPVGDGIGLRKLAKLIPNARLEIIDRAGHYIVLERPEEVASLIKSFLSEQRC